MRMTWRQLVMGSVGAAIGYALGTLVAVGWATVSGNLMMPAPVYEEKRAFIGLVCGMISGGGAAMGGLVGYFCSERRGR
jgi:hypothetical protein